MPKETELTPTNLFHTPASQEELISWIDMHSREERSVLYTVMGMTWNLCCKIIADEAKEDNTNGN